MIRVVNATGTPIDFLGAIRHTEQRSIDSVIPGIIDRSPVNEPLETGTLAIDALIPIGKGQRELIIGNRSTGKTALAIDAIINQKGKNVLCIYVAIGQRTANLARIINTLSASGALEYTTIINADAAESILNQYIAPYVGCTLAEYFRDQGHDVLIVYDDLSNHAIAYRQMSLLMRRSPGREAYPGDVFYLHSRLLERAGKVLSKGSITALPIVQIQSDDITAYIPTNLISITDGQLFLDTQLFKNGIIPAINIELSVSRVGGAAQTKAIKKVTRSLRLELAQYHELLAFSQFGSELDALAQSRLKRGHLIMQLLKQPQYKGYSLVDETLILWALQHNVLDFLEPSQVTHFIQHYVSYINSVYPEIYTTIATTQDLSEETVHDIMKATTEFRALYNPALQESA